MRIVSVHGALTTDFKVIASIKKLMRKIHLSEVDEYRIDCYKIEELSARAKKSIINKMNELGVRQFDVEINCPSQEYQPHVDDGDISFIVPIENGTLYINGINIPVAPFVIYSFDDGMEHNTNFPALMIKGREI